MLFTGKGDAWDCEGDQWCIFEITCGKSFAPSSAADVSVARAIPCGSAWPGIPRDQRSLFINLWSEFCGEIFSAKSRTIILYFICWEVYLLSVECLECTLDFVSSSTESPSSWKMAGKWPAGGWEASLGMRRLPSSTQTRARSHLPCPKKWNLLQMYTKGIDVGCFILCK